MLSLTQQTILNNLNMGVSVIWVAERQSGKTTLAELALSVFNGAKIEPNTIRLLKKSNAKKNKCRSKILYGLNG